MSTQQRQPTQHDETYTTESNVICVRQDLRSESAMGLLSRAPPYRAEEALLASAALRLPWHPWGVVVRRSGVAGRFALAGR